MKLWAAIAVIVVFSGAEGFIIPEELPSLLSLVYSNIPPVKKGTDSRVGLGFRLGPHADFQVLLELGPQTNTDPLSSITTENPAKREILVMKNTKKLADYVSSFRNYLNPGKKREKVSDSSTGGSVGGKWIDWWRKNLLSQSEIGKIKFKEVPGIDDVTGKGPENVIVIEKDPTTNENSVVDHLRQLYKSKQKVS